MLLPALSDIETLLERLIAFETTFAQGTIAITEFIEAWLDDHGVPHTRIDYETGHKTNLFATIGPDGPGGVV
ncbi:MAG TPA: acetylornithine deacetylase, partial [Aestuariivirga sp.]|nr:acetylornithine deacetylase [Aestuariivirga sp.]